MRRLIREREEKNKNKGKKKKRKEKRRNRNGLPLPYSLWHTHARGSGNRGARLRARALMSECVLIHLCFYVVVSVSSGVWKHSGGRGCCRPKWVCGGWGGAVGGGRWEVVVDGKVVVGGCEWL